MDMLAKGLSVFAGVCRDYTREGNESQREREEDLSLGRRRGRTLLLLLLLFFRSLPVKLSGEMSTLRRLRRRWWKRMNDTWHHNWRLDGQMIWRLPGSHAVGAGMLHVQITVSHMMVWVKVPNHYCYQPAHSCSAKGPSAAPGCHHRQSDQSLAYRCYRGYGHGLHRSVADIGQ